jgi:hypothetical protein
VHTLVLVYDACPSAPVVAYVTGAQVLPDAQEEEVTIGELSTTLLVGEQTVVGLIIVSKSPLFMVSMIVTDVGTIIRPEAQPVLDGMTGTVVGAGSPLVGV